MQAINAASVSGWVFPRPLSVRGLGRTQPSRSPAGADGEPALTGARGAAGAGRAQGGEDGQSGKTVGEARQDPRGADRRTDPGRPRGADGEPLSYQELKELTRLKKRDREVRAHERAHLAAARGLARGGARFSYRVGADGHRYAVGGEVSIDTSAANDPRATVSKMETVRRAALAPSTPSAQDRRVAAVAAGRAAAARRELAVERREEAKRESGDADDAPPADKPGPAGFTGGRAGDGAGDVSGAGNDPGALPSARASSGDRNSQAASGGGSPAVSSATLDMPRVKEASRLARAAHAGLQAARWYGREAPGEAAAGRVFTFA